MTVAPIAEVRRQELLQAVFSNEVENLPWIDRRVAREVLASGGLPFPGKGRWQYSDLAKVVEHAINCQGDEVGLEDTHSVDAAMLTSEQIQNSVVSLGTSEVADGFQMVDVNGWLFRAGSRILTQSEQTDARVVLRKVDETVDRHFVTVNPRSSLRLEETFQSGNRVLICRVRDHATLDYELLMPEADTVAYHGIVLWLGEGATLNLHLAALGGQLRRNEIVVHIVGHDATANLTGAWQLKGREHLDNLVCLRHRVGSGHSEQSFRGVVDERARASFTGLIHIDRNAAATEAHLSNRNISLSESARAVALPELEIYTDDVVCSHGATTGQLDRDALFLLRSRGLSEKAARSMLVKGFLRQVINQPSGQSLFGI